MYVRKWWIINNNKVSKEFHVNKHTSCCADIIAAKADNGHKKTPQKCLTYYEAPVIY